MNNERFTLPCLLFCYADQVSNGAHGPPLLVLKLGVDEPIFTRVNDLELSNFPPVLLDDDYMSMVLLNMHIDEIPVKFELF